MSKKKAKSKPKPAAKPARRPAVVQSAETGEVVPLLPPFGDKRDTLVCEADIASDLVPTLSELNKCYKRVLAAKLLCESVNYEPEGDDGTAVALLLDPVPELLDWSIGALVKQFLPRLQEQTAGKLQKAG